MRIKLTPTPCNPLLSNILPHVVLGQGGTGSVLKVTQVVPSPTSLEPPWEEVGPTSLGL